MKQVTTSVGIDAHKKDLFGAMLVGTYATPVTSMVPNEPAVRRLVEDTRARSAGTVRMCIKLDRVGTHCSDR